MASLRAHLAQLLPLYALRLVAHYAANMFGRERKVTNPEPADVEEDPRAPKGRPTPSRKEAEAARKQGLKAPRGTKEAKQAARVREREERARQRAGMMAGDERYLPARDKGPVRAMARDFVDSRFTVAEFFIFIALAVLVLGFINDQRVQSLVSLGFFILMALIIIDSAILLVTLHMRLKKQFPSKAERKGALLYAFMRTLQFRRLRLPPPRVKRGGAPATPKSRS